jgi:hypothetical protein
MEDEQGSSRFDPAGSPVEHVPVRLGQVGREVMVREADVVLRDEETR